MFVFRIAKEQVSRGYSVYVLILEHADEELILELQIAGVYVIEKNFYHRSLKPLYCINKIAKKYNVNIIHSHLGPAQYLVAISSVFNFRSPILITTEHSTYNNRRKWRILQPFEFFIYKKYNKIVSISEAVQKNLLDWIPYLNHKSLVIHNSIDLKEIRESKKIDLEKIYNIQRPIALCVGRLSYEKGHDILLRAASISNKFSLLIIGSGPELSNLNNLKVQLNLSDRVVIASNSSNVPSLMKGCDVYVQPSRWEGFGLAALEALACNTKVVVSNIQGLSDILDGHAISFLTEDPQSLSNAINLSIESKHFPPDLKWFENFSHDRLFKDYDELYRNSLSGL